MNLVPFEMLAEAVRPGHEVENIGGGIEIEQREGLRAGNVFPAEHASRQLGNGVVNICVNQCSGHG